jgi:hypothetical protein
MVVINKHLLYMCLYMKLFILSFKENIMRQYYKSNARDATYFTIKPLQTDMAS